MAYYRLRIKENGRVTAWHNNKGYIEDLARVIGPEKVTIEKKMYKDQMPSRFSKK